MPKIYAFFLNIKFIKKFIFKKTHIFLAFIFKKFFTINAKNICVFLNINFLINFIFKKNAYIFGIYFQKFFYYKCQKYMRFF